MEAAGPPLKVRENTENLCDTNNDCRLKMPKCQNCGSSVTRAYVRVFAPDGMDNPRVCPVCEDKVRDGADVREARSVRH